MGINQCIMNLCNHVVYRWCVGVVLLVFSLAMHAYIPPEIELMAVFDIDEYAVSGNQTVHLDLFYSDNLEVPFYEEVLRNVPFDNGVASLIIGKNGELFNHYFDRPDIVVSISVRQQNIKFPMNSVPYSIRSKESNKARRVDNEAIVKFLESERRVGVLTQAPELTLDVNGPVILGIHRPSDEEKNGVMMFNSNQNQFMGYRNGWHSMSWMPDPEDASKWARLETAIQSPLPVGIGRAPNSVALSVSNNVRFDSGLHVDEDIYLYGEARLSSGHGFHPNGDLSAASVIMPSGNSWDSNGNLMFSGILYAEAGPNLVGLHQFSDGVFKSEHLNQNIIQESHIQNQQIQHFHLSDGSVATTNMAPQQVSAVYIADAAIASRHIDDGAIQTHHMKKNMIASENVRGYVFLQKKFAPKSVLSRHVVDGQITSDKIKSKHIITDHFIESAFVDTQHIIDGSVVGDHVPLAGLPVGAFHGVLPLRLGGTGQSSISPYGVLLSSPQGQYLSEPNFFSVDDGHVGMGGLPSSLATLRIASNQNTQLGMVSDIDSVSVVFKTPSTQWQFQLTDSGRFELRHNDTAIMVISEYNRVGLGVSNPTEKLALNGPMILGESVATDCVPGSIKYSGGQFSLCFNNQNWSQVSPSGIARRSLLKDQLANSHRSSVVFAKGSRIIGDSLWVDSANDATIVGQMLSVAGGESSSISGSNAMAFEVSNANAMVGGSSVALVQGARIQAMGSRLADVTMVHATVDASLGHALSATNLHANHAQVVGVSESTIDANHSTVAFVDGSVIQSDLAHVRMVQASTILASSSQVVGIESSDIHARASDVIGVNHSEIHVDDSTISHVGESRIKGKGHVVFGGKHHDIVGDEHVAVSGDEHSGAGHRVVAIGSHTQSNHNDTVLLNASQRPLRSDRNGQLKIQADGGIQFKFRDDFVLSMADGSVGWANVSDANLKTIKGGVDLRDILKKISDLPLHYWTYKAQKDVMHIGPTAQDFHRIFQFGNSDKVIHSIDSDGVLLASVKGLNKVLDDLSNALSEQQSALGVANASATTTVATIDNYRQRIAQLEANIHVNTRLLKQFESDHNDQNNMINYITNAIRMQWWQRVCNRLLEPSSLGGIVLVGVSLGAVLGIRWRRFQ